jgi:hypothetical protein
MTSTTLFKLGYHWRVATTVTAVALVIGVIGGGYIQRGDAPAAEVPSPAFDPVQQQAPDVPQPPEIIPARELPMIRTSPQMRQAEETTAREARLEEQSAELDTSEQTAILPNDDAKADPPEPETAQTETDNTAFAAYQGSGEGELELAALSITGLDRARIADLIAANMAMFDITTSSGRFIATSSDPGRPFSGMRFTAAIDFAGQLSQRQIPGAQIKAEIPLDAISFDLVSKLGQQRILCIALVFSDDTEARLIAAQRAALEALKVRVSNAEITMLDLKMSGYFTDSLAFKIEIATDKTNDNFSNTVGSC